MWPPSHQAAAGHAAKPAHKVTIANQLRIAFLLLSIATLALEIEAAMTAS
jgi:hypothetical protein